ncbi:GAF domain-containing protein [Nocardioides sp. ChNu-153]|uniref:GAF domain-containing protein n=1 Tax=unclassified Nocardioides TaxID=2615069 RepID=UPI002406E55A|nr:MULTISPECIES: GAF domain-containing protein [unclassified Nocardioides]MDF9715171.1 GAF domain-containing protein [Nocardioides sp. ChNu-99]MDN7121050.1 GAF domain-containing protein [Nocardioides sp. ChNu-153]
MEPLPETVEAAGELRQLVPDRDVLEELREIAGEVQEIAPECVGLSISLHDHGATFTLASTSTTTAALDAVQYLDGGPCVESMRSGEVLHLDVDHDRLAIGDAATEPVDDSPLDEGRWHLYSAASAATGVLSSLSLPLLRRGRVIGGVNLYGSRPGSFADHVEELASVLGAWAHGAVLNADLTFSTLEAARRTPGELRDQTTVAVAAGILAAAHGISVLRAEEQLVEAARLADVAPAVLARVVVESRAP